MRPCPGRLPGFLFALAGLAMLVSAHGPAQAATKDQKAETCNFGADQQNLTGAKRKSYMAKCMSDRDSPRGKPVPGQR